MPDDRIHVVHTIPTLSFGGAERVVVDIINYADPEKFKFSVIIFFEKTDMMAQIKPKDVEVIVAPKRGQVSWGLFGAIQNELAKIKPSIVHTHLFGADVWGRVAAHRLNIPVITTEHNINVPEGFVKAGIKRYLKNYSVLYTATSGAIAFDLGKRYGISPNKIEVIRPGVPVEQYSQITTLKTLVPPFKLLILGRLTKQKGQDVALQALSRLTEFPWKLTIAGAGDWEKKLRLLTARLNLNSRVIFLPPVTNVRVLLEQNDIVIVPSRWEGLGVVAMEAAAAGRVVVASRVGGLFEVIRDGETGILFSPVSPRALAERLTWCFEHTEAAVALARAARNYAAEHFGVEAMARKYEEAYQRACHSE